MRSTRLIVLLLVTALVAAACGGDDEPAATTAATTTTAAMMDETTTTAAMMDETTTTAAMMEEEEGGVFVMATTGDLTNLKPETATIGHIAMYYSIYDTLVSGPSGAGEFVGDLDE